MGRPAALYGPTNEAVPVERFSRYVLPEPKLTPPIPSSATEAVKSIQRPVDKPCAEEIGEAVLLHTGNADGRSRAGISLTFAANDHFREVSSKKRQVGELSRSFSSNISGHFCNRL